MTARAAKTLKYDGKFALIVEEEGEGENGHYNLAVLDPDTYQWNAVNSVSKDSERLS